MKYEITFTYNNRNEEGGYDTEDLTKTKKVGKSPDEDISLDKLAAIITKEFSRRDILVKDVKVFEYVRKELSFRESKNGVVIGGKKFTPGLSEIMSLTEEQETPPPQLILPTPQEQQQYVPPPPPPPNYAPQPNQPQLYPHEIAYQQRQQMQQPQPMPQNGRQSYAQTTNEAYQLNPQQQSNRVASVTSGQTTPSGKPVSPTVYYQRHEVFDPPSDLVHQVQGMRLTSGKRYLIENEYSDGRSAIYKVRDDTGKELAVRSYFFRTDVKVPFFKPYIDAQGFLREQVTFEEPASQSNQPRLLYDNAPATGGGYQQPSQGLDPAGAMNKMDDYIRRKRGI